MIYTLTLNPAIDYYMSMGNFQLGSLNSLEEGYTLPGGKGINVSKVLKNFSVESKRSKRFFNILSNSLSAATCA